MVRAMTDKEWFQAYLAAIGCSLSEILKSDESEEKTSFERFRKMADPVMDAGWFDSILSDAVVNLNDRIMDEISSIANLDEKRANSPQLAKCLDLLKDLTDELLSIEARISGNPNKPDSAKRSLELAGDWKNIFAKLEKEIIEKKENREKAELIYKSQYLENREAMKMMILKQLLSESENDFFAVKSTEKDPKKKVSEPIYLQYFTVGLAYVEKLAKLDSGDWIELEKLGRNDNSMRYQMTQLSTTPQEDFKKYLNDEYIRKIGESIDTGASVSLDMYARYIYYRELQNYDASVGDMFQKLNLKIVENSVLKIMTSKAFVETLIKMENEKQLFTADRFFNEFLTEMTEIQKQKQNQNRKEPVSGQNGGISNEPEAPEWAQIGKQ